jgi:rod shape-determining protein MreC
VKRNVYGIVSLGLAVLLVIFLLALPDHLQKGMRKEALEVIGPVLSLAEKPVFFFRGMNSKLTTLDQAQAENGHLHEEVARLTVANQLLQDRATENARLREMIGFEQASPYELLPCHVIAREPSNWWNSVQVDVGWSVNKALDAKYHGKYSLTSDEPVVTPRGVVGKTGTVSGDVTDVILLVNENCNISATIQDPNDPTTHDQGIVQGQGNFDDVKPRVIINFLPQNSKVAAHQFVVTSGLGPYFPAGLRLGEVIDVPPLTKNYKNGFGLYRHATIEPSADLNQLDELFIVLGPKQQAK